MHNYYNATLNSLNFSIKNSLVKMDFSEAHGSYTAEPGSHNHLVVVKGRLQTENGLFVQTRKNAF